jgi:hypothetical protein
MQPFDRRAATAAYKERKPVAGIFAVRCEATGEIWVGRTMDVDKVWNRVVFSLRTGGNANRALQSAWNASGAEAFAFEVLESLDDEALAFARESALKDRMAFWREKLAAGAI